MSQGRFGIFLGLLGLPWAIGFPYRILFLIVFDSSKQDKIRSFGTISVITAASIMNLSILNNFSLYKIDLYTVIIYIVD